MYLEEIIDKLEEKSGYRPKRAGSGYSCRCPSHDDKNPSLSVSVGLDNRILLKCHTGCSTEAICEALGLRISDLFPRDSNKGCVDSEEAEYIYTNAAGKPLYKKVRLKEKQFYILSYTPFGNWEKGLKCKERVLYQLPEILEAKEKGEKIFLVEGEKDADRLRSANLVSTTPIEGAGGSLPSSYVDQLKGGDIILLFDEDKAGHRRRDQWLSLLNSKVASLRVVSLPGFQYQEKHGKDVSDWLREGHTVKELFEVVANTDPVDFERTTLKKGLLAVDIADFLSRKIPERQMILDPIIPSQGLVLLYSKRGVGKTFLSLAIGYAVAAGATILRWKCKKPVKVLYVDGEMPASLMQERISKLIAGAGIQLQDPSYFRLITPDLQKEGIPDISTSHGQSLIEEALGGAQLVIFDNISTLATCLQENEADAWGPIQNWILKLRKRGVSVLLVHHAGKGGQQRGTSRREDVLDTVIMLKNSSSYSAKDGASFVVQFEKARGFFGNDAEPFVVSLKQSNVEGALCWTEEAVYDENSDEVIEGIKQGKSYRKLAEELNITKSKVEGIVRKAREKGDLSDGKSCK